MKHQVEAPNEFRRVLSIEVDAAEVDAAFSRVYQDFAFRFPFEGYSAGEAPRQVIDDAFSAEAVAAEVGRVISEAAFGRALGEADLVAIGEPVYHLGKRPEPGTAFAFSAELDCSPLFELSSYEAIVIRMPDMNLAPHMMAALRKMHENEALHALQERLLGEAPEIMVDVQEQLQLQGMYEQANKANLPFDAYLVQQRIDPEHFKAELEEQAAEAVRRNLALDAWAAHIGVEVTDDMLAANFARSGVEHPKLEEARWRENGRIAELRQAIRRAGALRDIMQKLVIETI